MGRELPYEKFTIRWPESNAGEELYAYLHRLVSREPERVRKLKENGRKMSCFFDWYSGDERCSPFTLLLRRFKKLLDRRREDTERSAMQVNPELLGALEDVSSVSDQWTGWDGADEDRPRYWNADAGMVKRFFMQAWKRTQVEPLIPASEGVEESRAYFQNTTVSFSAEDTERIF